MEPLAKNVLLLINNIIQEDIMLNGPIMQIMAYEAQFAQYDREIDYESVWTEVERGNK